MPEYSSARRKSSPLKVLLEAAKVRLEPRARHEVHSLDSLQLFGSFFFAPLTLRANSPSCKTMSAYALSCHPQTIHRTLLTIKHQKPQLRLFLVCDPTSHAATNVITMAGHCTAVRRVSTGNMLSSFLFLHCAGRLPAAIPGALSRTLVSELVRPERELIEKSSYVIPRLLVGEISFRVKELTGVTNHRFRLA
jgi:hypothetical protein